jgi:hypothetical protein
MTAYKSQENCLVVTFQGRNLYNLADYKRSILALLARIEIENCSSETMTDLKFIYDLLSHLQTKEEIIANEQTLQTELVSESNHSWLS